MSVKKQLGSSTQDEQFMARAVVLARRGQGFVEPNPMVGCIIVRRGKIIGEGYHRRFGGPHAEIDALKRCSESTIGATAYVTLEPCCHHGKTPPCTDALLDARLSRVVVAHRDPNPIVRHKGIRRLRNAGVTVDVGICEREAAEIIAPFATRIRHARPYVIAKWAQSLDGKLVTRTGDSKWISSEPSRRRVHLLRARVDAVLVGSGTVLADDPALTARNVKLRRRAVRVILDGRLRTPVNCRISDTAKAYPTIVFTTHSQAKSRKADRLRRKGIEVIACRSNRGRIAVKTWLAHLTDLDVTNLLVEGGPTVLSSLLQAGLVDEAWIFTAPILIGGPTAYGALHGPGAARIADAFAAGSVRTQRSGTDVLHHLRLTDPSR